MVILVGKDCNHTLDTFPVYTFSIPGEVLIFTSKEFDCFSVSEKRNKAC